MKKDIILGGNILLDILYPINGYPPSGQLTTVLEGISRATGGAVCNVGIDLAKLNPSYSLGALGCVGTDEEGDFVLDTLAKNGLDTSLVKRCGKTSFTAVMSDRITNERTFFQYRGANAQFSEASFDWNSVDAKILHMGYILLLDQLDLPDAEYGTAMARLLAHAQSRGIKTSIDVVTEASERFSRLVPPALKYTDYCVINELEAQESTGIALRENGKLLQNNLPLALERLHELGVSEWAVIHSPEGGFGIDRSGKYFAFGRLDYPSGYIKGTVGAGDAFCAGVLAGAAEGMELGEAICLGIASATASLSEAGATDGMRTISEVLSLEAKFGHIKL